MGKVKRTAITSSHAACLLARMFLAGEVSEAALNASFQELHQLDFLHEFPEEYDAERPAVVRCTSRVSSDSSARSPNENDDEVEEGEEEGPCSPTGDAEMDNHCGMNHGAGGGLFRVESTGSSSSTATTSQSLVNHGEEESSEQSSLTSDEEQTRPRALINDNKEHFFFFTLDIVSLFTWVCLSSSPLSSFVSLTIFFVLCAGRSTSWEPDS